VKKILSAVGLWTVFLLTPVPLFGDSILFELDEEVVEFQAGANRWRIGSEQEVGTKGVTEYILEGEAIENWSERVTINYFKGLEGGDVITRLLDFTKRGLESQCAEVTWENIFKDENSALYQWTAKACVGAPDQSEIARVIFGRNALYVLHYANKKVPMPANQLRVWKKNLEEAALRA
jgi:hypothetical protein